MAFCSRSSCKTGGLALVSGFCATKGRPWPRLQLRHANKNVSSENMARSNCLPVGQSLSKSPLGQYSAQLRTEESHSNRTCVDKHSSRCGAIEL